MSDGNDSQDSGIGTGKKAYTVCFVGLEETLEILLGGLIPDARILSFAVPTLSLLDIDNAAFDLLKYLSDNYTLIDQENEWKGITLVTEGVAGFMVKQGMNLASTHENYRKLALSVSDLIFIETPHRMAKGSTWPASLEIVPSSISQALQDKIMSQVELICGSFLTTAKKHRIVNILAPTSSLVIDDFDCRILDYWLEINVVLTGDLTVSDIADRVDDLDRLRQLLAPPHMTHLDLRFPVRDYIAFLTDLAWSWRQMEDYDYRENESFMTYGHFDRTRLDHPSRCFQLMGPAGCGKKTMLRHLAFIQSRKLHTTTVVLIKEDFRSFKSLQMDILKSLICQILWQRPFVFCQLKAHLETFTDAEKWTEPSLWYILRFLCQEKWIGTLSLYVGDISDWLLLMRPLLQFLDLECLVQLNIVSTSKKTALTGLPPDTVVIDVRANCEWDKGIATLVHGLLPMQPWLKNSFLQRKIKEQLQQCRGDYLTAYIYLKQISRVTVTHTPAGIEQILHRLSRDREQLYRSGMNSVVDSGTPDTHWYSQTLSWILNSCRPLTVKELSVAVAISNVEPGFSMAEVKQHIEMEMWEDLCHHLGLFLRKEGEIVLSIHETARDWLLSIKSDKVTLLDHSHLAQLCLEYLLLYLPLSDPVLENAEEGAFLAYAARYWPEHSLLASNAVETDWNSEKKSSLDARIDALLSSPSLRDKWYRLFGGSACTQAIPTDLGVASELGLLSIAEKILTDKSRLELPGHELQSSLQLATRNGHQHLISLLLSKGAAVSPSLPVASIHSQVAILKQLLDYSRESEAQPEAEDVVRALKYASKNGSLDALEMLMRFIKTKMPDFDLVLNLPLEEAASRGHAQILKFLLQEVKEAKRSLKDDDPITSDALQQKTKGALHAACKGGDQRLIRQLLQWGMDPTVQGLEIAAQFGHTTIVKTFLAELRSRHDNSNWLHSSCALLKAAETGYSDVISLLVEAGSAIGFALADGETALHKAIRYGHKDVIEYLVRHEAETQRCNRDNVTPGQLAAQYGSLSIFEAVEKLPQPDNYDTYIMTAAENGHVLLIRYLIRLCHQSLNDSREILASTFVTAASKGCLTAVRELHQATIDINRGSGTTSALHEACSHGHHQVVEYLLSQGADANAQNRNGRIPLHLVIMAKEDKSDSAGLEDIITLLLGAGTDIAAKDDEGNTALHLAATHSFVWAAEAVLVAKGADVNGKDKLGRTALNVAAAFGNLEIIDLLLKNNADTEIDDEYRETPLISGTKNDHLEVLRVLLKGGANIEAADNEGWRALNLAACRGIPNIVQLLLDRKPDLEAASTRGWTALASAAALGHVDVVRLLIEHGAKIETENSSGCRPLTSASDKGCLDTVSLLLSHGANIEAVDNEGWGPLASAIEKGHHEIAGFLITNGANIEVPNNKGAKPLDIACANGRLEILQLLLREGAHLSTNNHSGWTPLLRALSNGHSNVARYLIEQNVDVNTQATGGRFPLGEAAKKGQVDIVRLLILKGAELAASDEYGFTSLHLAIQSSAVEVAAGLIEKCPVLTACTDLCGMTPLDWLPMQSAEDFYKQIPSLKGFRPTSQRDRESETRKTLANIITRLEEPDTDNKESLLTEARFYLARLGDVPSAVRSMTQRATFDSKKNPSKVWARCILCREDINEYGYFCTTCADIDFCAGCLQRHRNDPAVRKCIGHQYQDMRAPGPGSDNDLPSGEALGTFLADMRAKYGSA